MKIQDRRFAFPFSKRVFSRGRDVDGQVVASLPRVFGTDIALVIHAAVLQADARHRDVGDVVMHWLLHDFTQSMQRCFYLLCLFNRVIELTRSVRFYKDYLLQAWIQCLGIKAKLLSELFVKIETLDDSRNFNFEVGKLFLFFEHKEEGLAWRYKIGEIHKEGTVINVSVVTKHILASNVNSFNFHCFERSLVEDVLSTLAFVMYFFTTVWAQVLLTIFTEQGFHLIRGLLTFLAHELNFILVLGVGWVTRGTADLLAGYAPQWALRLLFALFALYCHLWLRLVFVFIYIIMPYY